MRAAEFDLCWTPLGSLLTAAGLLTHEQLEHALGIKEECGERLGEIVVALGFATEREIAGTLAEQYELEFVDLEQAPPDPGAVALLPEELARRYRAIPIRMLDGDLLLLGVTDPTDIRAADDLRLALGSSFRLAVVDPSQLRLALARSYGHEADGRRVHDIREGAASVPAIALVNRFLSRAVEQGATDIHVEPLRDRVVVRARVDGVVREVGSLPKHMQAAVSSRLKIMGGLDIIERRTPQEGYASVRFGGDPVDLRIAVTPTTEGEQIVLRLLSRRANAPTLAQLELSLETERTFLEVIDQPSGIVIVCGPAGSGRTTTLYGALDYLNDRDRVLMTIEDPVEHRLEGVAQIEVDRGAGLTFARGLRTILRSDPDVVLVGEIRDDETASIAVQAAMAGRLVLASLHADNAASAVVRLRELGVEPGLLAGTLNGIVAQRLARRLCERCRAPYEGLPNESELMLYRAVGCESCFGTGYSGRIALREVMPVRSEIRRVLARSADEISAVAVRHGMATQRADGMRLCLAGVCSLEEVRRVTGDRLT